MVLLILGVISSLSSALWGRLHAWMRKYMQYVVVTTKVGEVTLAILESDAYACFCRKWPPVITVMVIVFPK